MRLSPALFVLIGLVPACERESTVPGPSSPEPTAAPAALSELPCGEEFPVHARCGNYRVFEDRAAGSGRELELRWVVLPATGDDPLPDPVFAFAGGPGQAATELTVLANTQLAGVNERRDLVFVDQRGTGASNGLRCGADSLAGIIEGATAKGQREQLAACRERWEADLAHYGTTEAMADIDELRAALGYEQINIWGVSYGSRAALEYLRRHESSVRSVLVWGLAPPGNPYLVPFTEASQAALDSVLEDCAAQEDCAAMLPGGITAVDEILARLAEGPVELELVDPRNGQIERVSVDAELFMTGVRLTLYDANWSASLPAMLAAAHGGDVRPLMDFVVSFVVAVYSHIYMGMNISVTCSEDAPLLTAADLEAAASSRFGVRSMREYSEVCEDWPRFEVPGDWGEPVRSEVPVLLMNGELDPATPVSSAELAATGLGNARVVSFAKVAHGTSNAGECLNGLIRGFLERPVPEELDVGCAGEGVRPGFLVP